MTAAKLVLEPIFEAGFRGESYGFRPRRTAHHALEAVRVAANRGGVWVLDADIAACLTRSITRRCWARWPGACRIGAC